MILKKLLAIRPEAVGFSQLGFALCEAAVRERLERVLHSFAEGFNRAMAIDSDEHLVADLNSRFDAHHVGFAFEGAGMAFALRDLCTPWRPSRLRAFLDGPGRDHDYIAAVGAGLAVARLPWGRRFWPAYARQLDPLISWCVPDGYGFHQGIFHPKRYIGGRAEPPAALPPFARQLFDSGLGRSLWWSQGAAPRLIRRAIDAFAPARQPEMWCGIGVAAAYAGGVDEATLRELAELSGPHHAHFLSGIPFATRMRQKGGNPSAITDRASELLLGRTADQASDWLVATVERVLADESFEREVRVRDVYVLVRQRLVEELQNRTQGETPCRISQEISTASS